MRVRRRVVGFGLGISIAACTVDVNGTEPSAPPVPPSPATLDGGTSSHDGGGAPPDADPAPPACPPSWTVTATCGGPQTAGVPDFGQNVVVLDPSMSSADVQSRLDAIYAQQDAAEFGQGRWAVLFRPGRYDLDVKVGYYTQVLGLGRSPDDVVVHGAVRAKADTLPDGNATTTFWRAVESLAVEPSKGIDGDVMVWATSQGTHLRRVHVRGDVHLDDGGWSSGGFIADSLIDGTIVSGTQQQYLTRNDEMRWTGSNWNMVFVGDQGAPGASWPKPPYTTIAETPVAREKPFLYVDDSGHFLVMVPAPKRNSAGRSWASGAPPGSPLAIDRFYVAKPASDGATSMNEALAAGKHLLLTPGVYHLDAPLAVTRPGTIVMGLGLATLIPDNGTPVLEVADVDAVTLAGLLLEAGPAISPTLLEVGTAGSHASHAAAPTALFDVHCRVGGADPGKTFRCVTVNSDDVLMDNVWLWRADHGADAAWNGNVSDTGLVVNGDRVTAYGLFVEHFQKVQTLWNGNAGTVYLYQSEMPYDPPDQGAWQVSPDHPGYPSYEVADAVTSHTAAGLGVYSVFHNEVTAENAIETPARMGVSVHHMMTASLAAGSIAHIVNDTGGSVGHGTMTAFSND